MNTSTKKEASMRFGFRRYVWDTKQGRLVEKREGPPEIVIPPVGDGIIRVSRQFDHYIEKLKAEILKEYELFRKPDIERVVHESHDGNSAIVSFCRYIPPVRIPKSKTRRSYPYYYY